MWLDELTSNIDRTPRNPNLLVWHERLWLIDHGAALFFHHARHRGGGRGEGSRDRRPRAAPIAGPRPHPSFDASAIVSQVPPEWLDIAPESYVSFLEERAAFLV